MAEVNTDSGGGHGKHEKKRAKKSSTRIDMTPMVDLAFLLLTFFVMTSTFSKPKTMEVKYPADSDEKQKVKNAITFLLTGEDKIFYYTGELYSIANPSPDGAPLTQLIKTDYSKDGIRKVITENEAYKTTMGAIKSFEERYKRKEIVDTTLKRLVRSEQEKWEALTVLIKADDKATYKNVIDVIDELHITNVGRLAVIDLQQGELDLLMAMPK